MNMNIDGPYKTYWEPLLQTNPLEKVLIVSQMKSFLHYTYDRSSQHVNIDTVREIECETNDNQQNNMQLTLL